MRTKKITIEALARMINHGFEETAKKSELKTLFKVVDSRFDIVEERLDKIEKLILADHKRRIERLEDEMKQLKELFAIH